jgi:preprotein translocase subunit SecA
MIRQDLPDMIYKTEKGKYNAIVEEVIRQYKIGRPVLVGTTSIEKNEHISRLLTQRGVPHQLLNAKNHEREAQIIAEAGEKGSITVATNMAGRGVDIVLGGEPPSKYEIEDTDKKNKSNQKEFNKQMLEWEKKHEEVVALGGLYILGTERHESRRIDNQLRGRAGRQGDPGETRFFVSLEDDLMRIFGGEQISRLMGFFNLPEDQPLTHPMVSKAIEQAQIKVEGFNFDTRKHLVEFDDVLNKQREIIYDLRRKILILPEENLKKFKETVFETFDQEIDTLINQFPVEEVPNVNELIDNLSKELNLIIPIAKEKINQFVKDKNIIGLTDLVKGMIRKEYSVSEKKFGQEVWNGIVRFVFLSTIDKYFTEHLTAIEDLREGINLRGFAQRDPLIEYKNEAFSMFEKLLNDINFEIIRRIFHIEIEGTVQQVQRSSKEEIQSQKDLVYKSPTRVSPYEQSPAPQHLTTSKEETKKSAKATVSWRTVNSKEESPAPIAKKHKLGRNDPCWCGSGKKYKKCHYPN